MASIPTPIRKWIEQFASDRGFFQSSSEVDHDATSNRTHSGDDLSPATLEATTSLTDANGTTHSGQLADSADVSAIQSSSDVTVTDTQTGTISDGEFLKNSGGSLTGGTVQTEPNVPNWEPIGRKSEPKDTKLDLSINPNYELLMGHILLETDVGSGISFKFNNTENSNYDWVKLDGSTATGRQTFSDALSFPNGGTGSKYVYTFKTWQQYGYSDTVVTPGQLGNVQNLAGEMAKGIYRGDGPITSVQIAPGFGAPTLQMYGVDV